MTTIYVNPVNSQVFSLTGLFMLHVLENNKETEGTHRLVIYQEQGIISVGQFLEENTAAYTLFTGTELECWKQLQMIVHGIAFKEMTPINYGAIQQRIDALRGESK